MIRDAATAWKTSAATGIVSAPWCFAERRRIVEEFARTSFRTARATRVPETVIDGGVLEPAAQAHALRLLRCCGVPRTAVSRSRTELEAFNQLGLHETELVAGLWRLIDATTVTRPT